VLPSSHLVHYALGLASPMEHNAGRTPVDSTMAKDFDSVLARFQVSDEDDSGTIPCEGLRQVLVELGLLGCKVDALLADSDVADMICHTGCYHVGDTIYYQTFLQWIFSCRRPSVELQPPRPRTTEPRTSRPDCKGVHCQSAGIPNAVQERLSEKFCHAPMLRRAKSCEIAEVARIVLGRENVRRLPLCSTVELSMWDSSMVKQLGKTIHYKGFAARVNFEDQDTQIEKKRLMELFRHANPDTIVWDGDDYQSDSFTALIPDIYSSTHPRLVMFLRDTPEEKARVLASWTPTKLPIACFLLNAELSFEQLGSEALQATQSKTIFCFGGGAVLEKEWQSASKDVNFVLVRTQRDGPNPGDRRQISPLDNLFMFGEKHHNLRRTIARRPDYCASAIDVSASSATRVLETHAST